MSTELFKNVLAFVLVLTATAACGRNSDLNQAVKRAADEVTGALEDSRKGLERVRDSMPNHEKR